MPINQADFSPFVSVVSVVFRLFPVYYGRAIIFREPFPVKKGLD
jgi:hypothetical protein